MEISWFTLVWSELNIILLLVLCAIPVVLLLWLMSTQKRLARIEAAIEELRRTLPPQ
ncbi:MAG: hypothetical protein ABSC17_07475 [Thermacetogeniaceae bacterium]